MARFLNVRTAGARNSLTVVEIYDKSRSENCKKNETKTHGDLAFEWEPSTRVEICSKIKKNHKKNSDSKTTTGKKVVKKKPGTMI
jgi:hypothetical protein